MDRNEITIEAWHLFYQSFQQYDDAISKGNCILVEMMTSVNLAKKKNPDNKLIQESEKRIKDLFEVIDKFNGLNSKCLTIQANFKKAKIRQIELEQEIELLKIEIQSISISFNQQI